jgi:broad specificity phosphatase PhoE
MNRKLLLLVPLFYLTSCGHTYYVVRHAEKAQPSTSVTMSTPNNPPLSEEGKARALALSERLKSKKIRYIFSTNTIRTLTTAEPLSKRINITPVIYGSVPDNAFISKLRSLQSNALVVGHSNTIDDIVNELCNDVKVNGDLRDEEYDHLYVIKYTGKKIRFHALTYGKPAQ